VTKEEAEAQLLQTAIYCRDETCGDPIMPHFGASPVPRQRRRMDFRGSAGFWKVDYIFACPVCGKQRRFFLALPSLFGGYVIAEL